MTLETKRIIIAILGATFLISLLFVQGREVTRQREEAGLLPPAIDVPAKSKDCVDCHRKESVGIVDQWSGSPHARVGVACVDCHHAEAGEPDAYTHYGAVIATAITPRDCARCHRDVADEFERSHHAKGGNILASLDNFLAENVEGFRGLFDPHGATPGRDVKQVEGMASVVSGCRQCHGSKVALMGSDGKPISVDDLKPGPDGKPTNRDPIARVVRNKEGIPQLDPNTWPNTGIGRINLDGSLGSCSACHSRHDFSARRARQPEPCGKCHLGPDHPQKEIYEESKHGVAYRDLREFMNLDSREWVLGKDYDQAPTCATCHMSGNIRNGGKVTHDPGERISWTNRPPVSLVMDTDANHKIVTEADPAKRAALITSTWQEKRARMQEVCTTCHSPDWVSDFYVQYDNLVILYNEKFAKPGQAIMNALYAQSLLSKVQFDEEIEWTWYLLWHHEGRRARMGASMMAPDYTHWHGMFEVADRFYMQLIPQAREITHRASAAGKSSDAGAVGAVIDEILARPEHAWFEKAGAAQ